MQSTQKPNRKRCVRAATVLTLTGAAIVSSSFTTVAGSPFPLACASSDLRAWLRIERHGETGDVEAAAVGEGLLRLLEARHICGQQRISAALTLYESILPDPIAAQFAK